MRTHNSLDQLLHRAGALRDFSRRSLALSRDARSRCRGHSISPYFGMSSDLRSMAILAERLASRLEALAPATQQRG